MESSQNDSPIESKKLSSTIKGIIFIITLLWLICLILSFLQSYYQIIFPPIKSPLRTLHIIINGLLFMYFSPKIQTSSIQLAKIWFIFFNIILVVFTCIIIVDQILLGEYLSIICSICFLFPSTYRLYNLFFYKEQLISTKSFSSQLLSLDQNQQHHTINLKQKKKYINKIKTVCFCSISILVFLLLTMLSFSLISCTANYNQYKPIGKIIQLPINNDSETLSYHIYCSESVKNIKGPLIIFFHGAGSNLMAFGKIQQYLSASNIASCAYDRLGYGRSQSAPEKDQTPQINAQRINSLLKKAINTYYGSQYENISIALVGWSAGVQIIQNYYYHYPQNIKALIYADGYPNYLALQAISRNDSQYSISDKPLSTVLLLHFLKLLQPYISPFISPKISIEDQNIQDYYNAYSQTGYFWSSQYLDYTNKYSLTQQLTQKGNQDKWPKPYSNSTIDLNWPNIQVPLLILPASSTIDTQYNGKKIYYIQCQKYLEKATNSSKLSIIKGQHDYIIAQQASTVATQIMAFLLR